MSENANEPKGYSLHIGINNVDPDHYYGWDGDLNAPENDAKAMLQIAKSSGFELSQILLTEEARREVVLEHMLVMAKALDPGDLFLLTYSGHGGQLEDLNKDEIDGEDETWMLYDGQLIDDEVYWCLSHCKPGVRIFTIIDACHSGTGTKEIINYAQIQPLAQRKPKLAPVDILFKTFEKHKDFYTAISSDPKLKNAKRKIEASVIHISACQDFELALDGDHHSLFTESLLEVWDQGNFNGSYGIFLKQIQTIISKGTPNFLKFGKKNSEYIRSKPFSI